VSSGRCRPAWVRRAASATRLLWPSSGEVEQTKNVPPRHALRLDDLRPWHVIVATCVVCQRRAHVAAALLHHGRPPYTRVLDVERKLCCTGCGNRRGNTLTVSMAPKELSRRVNQVRGEPPGCNRRQLREVALTLSSACPAIVPVWHGRA
jgi:hypothetical protein